MQERKSKGRAVQWRKIGQSYSEKWVARQDGLNGNTTLAEALLGDAEVVCVYAATPRRRSPNLIDVEGQFGHSRRSGPVWPTHTSLGTQSALGEGPPDGAGILPTSVDLICLQDSIAVVEEVRAAWLKLEAVNKKLDGVRVAVSRVSAAGLRRGGVEAVKCRAVGGRREKRGTPSVLGNESLRDLEQHFGVDGTDGMNLPVPAFVERGENVGIDGLVRAIWVWPDASIRAMSCPFAHSIVMYLAIFHADERRVKIAVPFSHTTRLTPAKTWALPRLISSVRPVVPC